MDGDKKRRITNDEKKTTNDKTHDEWMSYLRSFLTLPRLLRLRRIESSSSVCSLTGPIHSSSELSTYLTTLFPPYLVRLSFNLREDVFLLFLSSSSTVSMSGNPFSDRRLSLTIELVLSIGRFRFVPRPSVFLSSVKYVSVGRARGNGRLNGSSSTMDHDSQILKLWSVQKGSGIVVTFTLFHCISPERERLGGCTLDHLS